MDYLVLGIETSCDETAAAIYSQSRGIVSSVLFSQIHEQEEYGGVVPELASRVHLEKMDIIVHEALEKAGCTLDDIDVIAVTHKPGLPGSLLIGLCFAKGIAWAREKKFIGIDHLEGHIFSSCIENKVPFPHLCLTVSGGHSSLYRVDGFGDFTMLGHTIDDAAGEAFDKVAKLLNLPYPGGPIIEKLAGQVAFEDFFHYPRSRHKTVDFSFSGLKTAIMYDLVKRGWYDMKNKTFWAPDILRAQQQVASSLQVCMKDIFIDKLSLALDQNPHVKAITFVGGVACNNYLRQHLTQFAAQKGLPLYSPSRHYCTDNAAMIAFVGAYKAQQGKFSDFTIDIMV